jgi:hypothetical protein
VAPAAPSPALPAGTPIVRTVSNLYPYAGGYEMFAGECTDSDPGQGLRAGPVTTDPGGSTTLGMTLPSIDVQVNNVANVAVANADVTIEHRGTDALCGASATKTYYAGKTDSTGKLRVMVPYGKWGVKATLTNKLGTSPDLSVVPGGSNLLSTIAKFTS